MEIRNRETGAVITISEFKAEHPRTSFPKRITAEVLDGYGYDVVLNGPDADLSGPYQVNQRDGVEQINGKWYSRYVAGPVFTDNDEQTAAEQEAAYRSEVDTKVAADVRAERNQKLADCDWTQLGDSTADSTAWATYRQALRDLPSADGFPHSVTWPAEPS